MPGLTSRFGLAEVLPKKLVQMKATPRSFRMVVINVGRRSGSGLLVGETRRSRHGKGMEAFYGTFGHIPPGPPVP
eukprot:1163731-Rhodomonas_salina.1